MDEFLLTYIHMKKYTTFHLKNWKLVMFFEKYCKYKKINSIVILITWNSKVKLFFWLTDERKLD